MDSDNGMDARDDADQRDDGTNVDQPSTTIIGANLAGANSAPFPGGIVAPAAALAATESAAEDNDTGEMNFDALEQFGAGRSDPGVSAKQSEMEAGELNG